MALTLQDLTWGHTERTLRDGLVPVRRQGLSALQQVRVRSLLRLRSPLRGGDHTVSTLGPRTLGLPPPSHHRDCCCGHGACLLKTLLHASHLPVGLGDTACA